MTTVSTTHELQAALQAGVNPRTITVASSAGGNARLKATQAERTRCVEIYKLAGSRYRSQARNAIQQGTTLEAFGSELFRHSQTEARSQAESKNAVAAITRRWESGASTQERGSPADQDAVSAITRKWQNDH